MQLNILQHHDPETSKAILAAAALNESGTPYQSSNANKFEKQAQQLLEEIKLELGIEGDSSEDRARMRDAISELVIQTVMSGSSLSDVKSRLAIKGELPLSAYRIKFAKGLLKQSGENENFIRRAIKADPEIQHILPKNIPVEAGVRGMTLMVIPQKSSRGNDHWIILDAMRSGDELVISDIFRVFPEVVDLSEACNPLDVLKAFVKVYGIEFQIDSLRPQKFFENLVIPKSEDDIDYTLPEKDVDLSLSTTGSTVRRVDQDGNLKYVETHIIASYCVDYTKYKQDKAKRHKR